MSVGFTIYLIFIVSWFTHLSTRIPALGVIRFDLCIVLILICFIVFGQKEEGTSYEIKASKTHKIITFLLIYIIVTLPFVQWPGSVIHNGLEAFIKAIVFYYFTIYFVTDEAKLKRFIFVFLGCQSFRIIEPVYLHITQGYWGSFASMSGWEYMDRLSGAPNDIVNPNGLAFIILTVIPFYYFLSKTSILTKITAITLIPLSIYALILTGSRSGLIGLLVIFASIIMKSENKLIIISIICIGTIVAVSNMGANTRDRYESIFNSDAKNAGTAEGRIEGVRKAFFVAFRKPFFGHGLGTSCEANANFAGEDKPAHDLYAEVAQELGFVGLLIFIFLILSIVKNYKEAMKSLKDKVMDNSYITSVTDGLQVWFYMNILFSFASYGLSSYEWYLFAGLSVAILKICSVNRHIVETHPLSVCKIMS